MCERNALNVNNSGIVLGGFGSGGGGGMLLATAGSISSLSSFQKKRKKWDESEASAAQENPDDPYSMDNISFAFHHGSHYSSPPLVLYYMVRLQPYTEMARNLQGGKFD